MSNPDAEIATIGWTVGRTLGEGAFGLVKLVTRKSDGHVEGGATRVNHRSSSTRRMDPIDQRFAERDQHGLPEQPNDQGSEPD